MTRKVLIAETNQIDLQRLVSFFHVHGHQVVVARDGTDAGRTAAADDFDLVVIDVYGGCTDASTVIAGIKGQPIAAPVIATTAEHTLSLERTLRSQGVDYYFAKPYALSDFAQVVDHLFRMHDRVTESMADSAQDLTVIENEDR